MDHNQILRKAQRSFLRGLCKSLRNRCDGKLRIRYYQLKVGSEFTTIEEKIMTSDQEIRWRMIILLGTPYISWEKRTLLQKIVLRYPLSEAILHKHIMRYEQKVSDERIPLTVKRIIL